MKIGVYPGTFDPITNGHLDIIKRAYQLFDKLYIVVPNNIGKNALFTTEERIKLIKLVLTDYPDIEVASTDNLTVEFAKSVNATVMIRGLRMVSDFDYELQLATINKQLDSSIETVFIMSSHEYSFLSSSSVKEIAKFKRDVSLFVPDVVNEALKEKYK
ncbi:MAG: pantetheine-phosphate adenylyltransferase [Erysipelotrichaceae bacterium]|nr:pantetheine-phosphate adenylyltransferase [Erysipelotrichaceae bacterium]